ncbi:MAG TPA: methyltransferase domain-containing protein [Treponemataceae bacterium]|nr:methyltransferase domain-containing protein [Treponemataceae bacterium]
MTLVIIQCRLGSTRLPSKALLPLGSQTCIEWTLSAMKKVQCDEYYLATDQASYSQLFPLAEKNGWKCFAGSENDVLDRFCSLIRLIEQKHGQKVAWIVRATGDNPFLFYDSAQNLLNEAAELRSQGYSCDYCTYSGLPHGSGVEILNAQSLLQSQSLTQDPYDTEHVGPALYNHTDVWTCFFLPAPQQWNHPELRTTIDTYDDYRRAIRIVTYVSSCTPETSFEKDPFRTEQILSACEKPWIQNPVLCIPQTKTGFGTGHAKRMISLASKLKCDILIPEDSSSAVKDLIQKALDKKDIEAFQIISSVEPFQRKKSFSLVVTDYFKLSEKDSLTFSALGPLVSVDESLNKNNAVEYLIEIIPSISQRDCNLKNIMLLDLPEMTEKRIVTNKIPLKVLVSIGGEDPASLSYKAALACAQAASQIFSCFLIDVITNNNEEFLNRLQKEAPHLINTISFMRPVQDLSARLKEYNLVISHYGLTAFETCSLNIPLILLETTKLHGALAKKYGFAFLSNKNLTAKGFFTLLIKPDNLKPAHPDFASLYKRDCKEKKEKLPEVIQSLLTGSEHVCPLCGKKNGFDVIVCRTENKTVRRCRSCSILYPSWTSGGALNYNKTYFFEEYKKQYGKTYLQDFDQIKQNGSLRVTRIKKLLHGSSNRTVLDVGCAYGPFLAAVKEAGFIPLGTDISSDAADYVADVLKIPSCTAVFPQIDIEKEFNVKSLDALTMWFVIEHFQQLDSVLKKTHSILNDGGVFAFSTPNASGVSARFSPKKFFSQSPLDHFTLWEMPKCRKILKRYGFTVRKIVCTGHHSERFPIIQKTGAHKGSLLFSLCTVLSKVFSLGDTFEVYCIKFSNKL